MKFLDGFSRLYARLTACFILMLALALFGIGRVAVLSSSEFLYEGASDNCIVYNLCDLRGTIYDTNMRQLTNNAEQIVAVVLPTKAAKDKIGDYLDEKTRPEVLEQLRSGKAAVVYLNEKVKISGVYCYNVLLNQPSNQVAQHVLGYVNSDGIGIAGLEAAYDSNLKTNKSISFKIPCDASGKAILGFQPEIDYDMTAQNSGVITTIDLNLQKIAETAAESIQSGAIVITEVGTGKIRAMVSKPGFDPLKLADALKDPASPLLNRALSAYNVGSVFKPCVAAAALESGAIPSATVFCSGKSNIGGRNFHCNLISGHGKLSLKEALSVSCNCYFYSVALKTKASSLHEMASSFPFGKRLILADGIVMQPGSLTSKSALAGSEATTANFAIGQGDLLLSPLAVSVLYEAVASGGVYHLPTLIEGTVQNGKILRTQNNTAPTRVFSEETAEIIRQGLTSVILEGTGKRGDPKFVSAAGKTATAETGWIKNGAPVTQGWFCGFFPANQPKYVVCILAEGATSGGKICAPVFGEIADACVLAGLVQGDKNKDQ